MKALARSVVGFIPVRRSSPPASSRHHTEQHSCTVWLPRSGGGALGCLLTGAVSRLTPLRLNTQNPPRIESGPFVAQRFLELPQMLEVISDRA